MCREHESQLVALWQKKGELECFKESETNVQLRDYNRKEIKTEFSREEHNSI